MRIRSVRSVTIQPARLPPLLPTVDPSDSPILSGKLPFLAPLVQWLSQVVGVMGQKKRSD